MCSQIAIFGGVLTGLLVCGCGSPQPPPAAPLGKPASSVPPPSKVVAMAPDTALTTTATCGGNYQGLLHAVESPEDAEVFGQLFEFGYWTGSTHARQNGLKPGYWVYAAPFWFIWEKSSSPSPLEGRKTPPPTSRPTPGRIPAPPRSPEKRLPLPGVELTGSSSYHAFALSKDGSLLANDVWEKKDRKIVVWDTNSGEVVSEFPVRPPIAQIMGMAFAEDDRLVLLHYSSDYASPLLYVWSRKANAIIKEIAGRKLQGANYLVVSDDGSLAAVSDSERLRVFDLSSGNVVASTVTRRRIGNWVFAEDKKALVGVDRLALDVWLFDNREPSCVALPAELWSAGSSSRPPALFRLDDGTLMVFGDREIRRYRLDPLRLVSTLPGGLLDSVSGDGRLLVGMDRGDNTTPPSTLLYDGRSGEYLGWLPDGYSVRRFSADSQRLALTSVAGPIRVWNVSNLSDAARPAQPAAVDHEEEEASEAILPAPATVLDMPQHEAIGFMWSSDGQWLATEHAAHIQGGFLKASLATWDMATKRQTHEPLSNLRLLWPAADGNGFGCYNTTTRQIEVVTVPAAETIKAPPSIPSEEPYYWIGSPDGRFILNRGSKLGAVFDSKTGNLLHQFDFPKRFAAAFTTDGQALAVETSPNSVALHDTSTWGRIAICKHPAPFSGWVLSSDGRWLASFHMVEEYQAPSPYDDRAAPPRSYYLCFWDARGGSRQITPLTCVRLPDPRGLIFSPDDTVLVLADWRGLELWNVVGGTLQRQPNGRIEMDLPERGVRMSFSPDGRHFALGTSAGTRVWGAEEVLSQPTLREDTSK